MQHVQLIDKTYFEDADLLIPGMGKETQVNKVNELIAKYEPEYLKAILGYGFYKMFMDALGAAEGDDELLDIRWKDLRDGADYVNDCNETCRWEGFTNDLYLTPINRYVYYYFLRKNVPTTTVSGEKESKSDKSKSVSSVGKQVRAWNEMVGLNRVLVDFLLNKKDDNGVLVYPEFKAQEPTRSFVNLLQTISGL